MKDYGNTPLIEAIELGKSFSLPNLYLKLESRNPTGTHKDRIAIAHVTDAVKKGAKNIIVASCGNYGAAVAFAASKAGIKCEVVIPKNFESPRTEEIKNYGASITILPLTYEECVKESSLRAATLGLYDANPGEKNSLFQRNVYRTLAQEIATSLPNVTAIGIPFSNGTTLAGVWEGFKERNLKPKMYGGSVKDHNPIITSFENKEKKCRTLLPNLLMESEANEPLINWYSFDGDHALAALYESEGVVYGALDEELIELSKIISKLYEPVHPASVAGILALKSHPIEGPLVAIITSKAY